MDVVIGRTLTQIGVLVFSLLGAVWTLQYMTTGKQARIVGVGLLVLLIHSAIFSAFSMLVIQSVLDWDTTLMGWWAAGVRMHSVMTIAAIMWYRVNGHV